MNDHPRDIKSMKLYSDVDRIHNELRVLGIADDDPLSVDVLSSFDQYHYHGTDAVDTAARLLDIGPASEVLEVGSGVGGPARYLAHGTGCHVTAAELQTDLDTIAAALTKRCGLAARVSHVCGDFLDSDWRERFDAIVSWLALYHIPDRAALFARCHTALRAGGAFYAEDLCRHGEFNAGEQERMSNDLYGHSVLTLAEYEAQLDSAGFTDIQVTDMTADWRSFCGERIAAFRNGRDRQLAVHGATIVENLDHFYAAVDALFRGGKLGGVRVVARKHN